MTVYYLEGNDFTWRPSGKSFETFSRGVEAELLDVVDIVWIVVPDFESRLFTAKGSN
jgi:hypothetical protein